MKLIQLSRGLFAKVDDADYEFLNQWKWYAKYSNKSNSYYAARMLKSSEISEGGKRTAVSMHRIILGENNPKVKVDHKDIDTLNCQRANLRKCSHQQNCCNKKSSSKSSSKFLGVHLSKTQNLFISSIRSKGVKMYIGSFPNTPCGELLAALKYDLTAENNHGEFANLNFSP